jgi:hypothetical protein
MKNKIFILLAFISGISFAQESGLGVQEIQVTESFIPIVPIANKIMDLPQTQDTFKVNTEVEYFLNSKQYLTSFNVDTISPAKIKGEPLSKLYSSFIKLGLGNHALPYADFYYNSRRDKSFNYGLRLGFWESYLKTKNDFTDNRVSTDSRQTNLRLFAKKIFDFGSLKASLNREGNNLLAYGVTSEVDKSLLNQYWGYSTFDISIESNAKKYVDYFAKVFVSDVNEQTESIFGFRSKMASSYNNIDFAIALDVDYDLNNFNEQVNFYDSKTRELITSIVPVVIKDFKGIQGEYGLNYVMVNNPDSSASTNSTIYPKVHLDYTFVDDIFRTYIGLDGGLEPNSYWNLSKENPFVLNALDNGNRALELINSDVKYNVYVGMESKLASNMFFSSKLSYAKIDFIPFFELDQTSAYQNKFQVVYDNGTHLNFSSMLDYKISSSKGLSLSLDYQSFNLDTLSSYNYKPTFRANLRGYYNIANTIFASAEVFAEFDRSTSLDGNSIEQSQQLKDIIDLNLLFEYKINTVFSSYLSAKNLIGGYQLWQNYSALSPQIQIGITYRY